MKTCILAFVILFCILINAQDSTDISENSFLSKGMVNLGGTISYSNISYKGKSASLDYFNLTPIASYFLSDKFALGLSLQYNSTSNDIGSTEYLGAGPFARYYFLTDRIAPFLTAGFTYGKAETETKIILLNLSIINKTDYSSTKFDIGGGLDYFLVKNIALEVLIKYTYSIEKNENVPDISSGWGIEIPDAEIKSSQISFAFGINVFI